MSECCTRSFPAAITQWSCPPGPSPERIPQLPAPSWDRLQLNGDGRPTARGRTRRCFGRAPDITVDLDHAISDKHSALFWRRLRPFFFPRSSNLRLRRSLSALCRMTGSAAPVARCAIYLVGRQNRRRSQPRRCSGRFFPTRRFDDERRRIWLGGSTTTAVGRRKPKIPALN
jgi:hypothetical protein